MNIRQRILLAPATAVLLLIVCGIVAYRAISAQDAALAEINGIRIEHLKMGAALSDRIARVHTNMFRLVTWYNSYDQATQASMTAAVERALSDTVAELDKWLADAGFSQEEKAHLQAIQDLLEAYGKATEAAIYMVAIDVTSALGDMRNVEAKFESLKQAFDSFNALEAQLSSAVFHEVRDASRRALSVNAALVVLAVVVAGLFGLVVARSLLRQLGGEPSDAVRIAQRIAGGDLTRDLPPASPDSLLAAISQMQQSLRSMVQTLFTYAGQLSASAAELSSGAENVAQSSKGQSQAAASMAATVEELIVSFRGVADNAGEAMNLSRQSGNEAESGSEIILSTAREMEQMAASARAVSATVSRLGESTERISSVVTVIQEVSEQTNLLALNAAIEAARAAQHGRGFAVVAGEVRQLAGRAAQSTNEIRQMIADIQASVHEAVTSMGRFIEQVEQGVQLANGADGAIRRIRKAAEQVVDAVGAISGALREQTSATNEIATSVANIARMSEENSERAATSSSEAKAIPLHTSLYEIR